jgi:hypothetical protein
MVASHRRKKGPVSRPAPSRVLSSVRLSAGERCDRSTGRGPNLNARLDPDRKPDVQFAPGSPLGIRCPAERSGATALVAGAARSRDRLHHDEIDGPGRRDELDPELAELLVRPRQDWNGIDCRQLVHQVVEDGPPSGRQEWPPASISITLDGHNVVVRRRVAPHDRYSIADPGEASMFRSGISSVAMIETRWCVSAYAPALFARAPQACQRSMCRSSHP